jgi:hypothetical protein
MEEEHSAIYFASSAAIYFASSDVRVFFFGILLR